MQLTNKSLQHSAGLTAFSLFVLMLVLSTTSILATINMYDNKKPQQ